MYQTILPCLKYLFILTKLCGVCFYSIKLINKQYVLQVSKADRVLMITLLLAIPVVTFLGFYKRSKEFDQVSFKDHFLLLIGVYWGNCILALANVISSFINREEVLLILTVLQNIEKESNIKIDYNRIRIYSIKIILFQLVLSVVFLLLKVGVSVENFKPFHILMVILPISVDSRFIIILYILRAYTSKVNYNLNILKFSQIKDKYLIVNAVEKSLKMYCRLHSLCIEINKNYKHIALRIGLAFTWIVFGAFWTFITVAERLTTIRTLSMLTWTGAVFNGICLILNSCESVMKEVSFSKVYILKHMYIHFGF